MRKGEIQILLRVFEVNLICAIEREAITVSDGYFARGSLGHRFDVARPQINLCHEHQIRVIGRKPVAREVEQAIARGLREDDLFSEMIFARRCFVYVDIGSR